LGAADSAGAGGGPEGSGIEVAGAGPRGSGSTTGFDSGEAIVDAGADMADGALVVDAGCTVAGCTAGTAKGDVEADDGLNMGLGTTKEALSPPCAAAAAAATDADDAAANAADAASALVVLTPIGANSAGDVDAAAATEGEPVSAPSAAEALMMTRLLPAAPLPLPLSSPRRVAGGGRRVLAGRWQQRR